MVGSNGLHFAVMVGSNSLQDLQVVSEAFQLPCNARKLEVFALVTSICSSGQLSWSSHPHHFVCRAEDATIDNPNDSPRPKDRTKMGQPNSSEWGADGLCVSLSFCSQGIWLGMLGTWPCVASALWHMFCRQVLWTMCDSSLTCVGGRAQELQDTLDSTE